MKRLNWVLATAAGGLLLVGCTSHGQGTRSFPMVDVVQTPYAYLVDSTPLYFLGGDGTPVSKKLQSRRSSAIQYSAGGNNKFSNRDEAIRDACYRSFAYAVSQFMRRAPRAGATKVIHMTSYAGHQVESDPTKFICSIGRGRVAVYLNGVLAK